MARLLVVTNMYPPHHLGGYEQSCAGVVDRWRQAGHEVTVLTTTMRLPGAPSGREAGVRRELTFYWEDHELTNPPLARRFAAERANQRVVTAVLDEIAPEVVSVWNMGAINLALLTCVRDRSIPIVFNLLDEWLTSQRRLDAWTRVWRSHPAQGRILEALTGVHTAVPDFSYARHVFCSETTREMSRQDPVWGWERSEIVPLGTDFAVGVREPGPWHGRLLYVGRIDERKGMDTLVRALAQVPPKTTVTFAGRGDPAYRQRLEELAAELDVGNRITFTAVPHDELPALYRQADAVVFPSLWAEPFGLVPIEAMACGTPVIATGTGGSGEFLEDGGNCVLFAAGDVAALASAVTRLGADPALRETIVAGGATTAGRLTADAQAARLLDIHLHEAGLTPGGLGEAWAKHNTEVAGALAAGDPDEIKRVYVSLGTLLDDAVGGDLEDVPLLSLPETAPVVAELLAGVSGPVLDAGCGPMPGVSITLVRQDPVRPVLAMDIGFGTVRLARRTAAGHGVHVLCVVGDLERLPFRDAVFAGIVCDDTIEHVPDDRRAVQEIDRCLWPGGRALIATPNRRSAEVLVHKGRDRLRGHARPPEAYYAAASHLREYTWPSLAALVEPTLSIRRRAGVGWPGGGRRRVATVLTGIGPLRGWSRMVVIDARKRA